MNDVPRISEGEWEVMQCLWKKSPLTSQEIIDQMGHHPQTIKTYLGRLAKKEAVRFSRQGRAYLYEPMVTERECQRAESHSFLSRVFGGSVKPLLTHMVEEEQLSDEELNELRQLLRRRKSK